MRATLRQLLTDLTPLRISWRLRR